MEELLNQVAQDVLPSQLGEVYETLAKVLKNIYQNPSEPKFRTLKKENKLIRDKVCKSQAAISLLLAVGFEDDGATFHCPEGVDLVPMGEAIELLQCMAVSCKEDAPVNTTAQDPTPAMVTEAAGNGGTTGVSGGTTEKVAKTHAVDPEVTVKKQPVKSAFDFEIRSKQEERQQNAEGSLADLRQQQRSKFQDFKADPNAAKQMAYQQPPSVANGAVKQGWGDWMGGMFGGGSSGSGSGARGGRQQPPNDRRGPNVKGISDLPKPVQRG